MSVQSELRKLNDKIKVDFDAKKELSEKRDILIEKLNKSGELPSFEMFNQGSYAMYTGISPEDDGEYDIDVALIFSVNKDEYEPLDLKNKICEILKNHTDYGAVIKKSCVTVTYKKAGEAKFHVDLVVYVYENKENHNSQLFIAKGKNIDSQEWEKADPKGLVNYINCKVEKGEKGEKRDQFRRVVRYLKKWKNIKFSNVGHANPPSIGITLLAVENFEYSEDSDLDSLIYIAEAIKNKFVYVGNSENGKALYRLKEGLPCSLKFEPNTDVFQKMTDAQMTDFMEKLAKLERNLEEVRDEVDELEQYKKLKRIFGDDFNVPDANDTAKEQRNYIPYFNTSGME